MAAVFEDGSGKTIKYWRSSSRKDHVWAGGIAALDGDHDHTCPESKPFMIQPARYTEGDGAPCSARAARSGSHQAILARIHGLLNSERWSKDMRSGDGSYMKI